MNGYIGVCANCRNYWNNGKEEDCNVRGWDMVRENCPDFSDMSKPRKPNTHADRIRAMSDEELAHFIDEFWSAAWCPDDPPVDPETNRCLMHDGECVLCILDWLKREAET